MKYSKYSSYKDSGVEWLGDVPDSWSRTKIKYLALGKNTLFIDGDWIESKDITASGIKYITTGNIGEGNYKEQGFGFISDNTFKKLNCTEIFKDDLILSRLNLPIGRACILPELNNRVVMAVDNVVIRPSTQYDKQFLLYLFSSSSYFQHTALVARGATMQRISRGLLGNVDIPLLELVDQQAIANYLDKATDKIDTLISKQTKLIELLKEKRQALISHAVTKGLNPHAKMKQSGVEWLGEIPEGWLVSKVKFYCNVKGRIGFRGYTKEDLVTKEEGALVIGASEINSNTQIILKNPQYISWHKFYESPEIILKKNDILFVQRGSTVGKVAYIDYEIEEATINPSLVVLKKIKLESEYLKYFLMSNIIRATVKVQTSNTAIPMISQEQIGNYILSNPPMSEQQAIANYLDNKTQKIDNLIKKATKAITLLKERRTALISSAVTGKIDVRGIA